MLGCCCCCSAGALRAARIEPLGSPAAAAYNSEFVLSVELYFFCFYTLIFFVYVYFATNKPLKLSISSYSTASSVGV